MEEESIQMDPKYKDAITSSRNLCAANCGKLR